MLQEQAVSPHLLASLRNLMGASALNEFRLVGGTALALYLGHRISVDIDLFTDNKNAPILTAKSMLIEDYNCEITNEYMDMIKGKYIGFSCSDKGTRYDIQIINTKFIDPLQNIDGIRLASMRDIAVSKLNTITGRETKKDYIDLYYLHEAIDLVNVFNHGFFTVFPLQKTREVLVALANAAKIMSNDSEMPEMLSESFDIEQLNSTLTLVAHNCFESRGIKKEKNQFLAQKKKNKGRLL